MDKAGIEQVLQLYFDAGFERDGEKMRQTFFPEAHVYGIFEGDETVADMPRDIFVERVVNAPETSAEDRRDEIHFIEFSSERSAVAKVSLRVHDILFTDLLTFIRQNGEWRIIAKQSYGKKDNSVKN